MKKYFKRNIPSVYFKGKRSALLVLSPTNVLWLTGFKSTSSALILFKKGRGIFITDARYAERAEKLKGLFDVKIAKNGIMSEVFNALENINKVMVDTEEINGFTLTVLKNYFVEKIEQTPGLFKNLRAIKENNEISFLRSIYSKHKNIINTFASFICSNADKITEKEAGRELKKIIINEGFDDFSFEPMVLQGKNSSVPHGENSDDVISLSEPLLVDFGGILNMWNTDETVMIYPEKLKDKSIIDVHKEVKGAMELATEKIKEGMKGSQCHKIAVDYLKKKKLDKYFIHGLGHGIGLEIHEKPVLAPESKDIIKEGMVFTIEPGVYIRGKWGVRLERTVTVKKGKPEMISSIEKEPIFV